MAEPHQQMEDSNLVETPPHDSGEVHQCDRWAIVRAMEFVLVFGIQV